MRVAVVHWEDACATDPLEYFDEETSREVKAMASVDCGFLVRDGKDGVLLARHASDSGFRGMMFIPRKCVRSIKVYGGTRG
jgi:hypothetical protein